jgi:hypothetical protein
VGYMITCSYLTVLADDARIVSQIARATENPSNGKHCDGNPTQHDGVSVEPIPPYAPGFGWLVEIHQVRHFRKFMGLFTRS